MTSDGARNGDTVKGDRARIQSEAAPVAEVSIMERLDEEKIGILRSWGAGLSADERDEVRAAGKAIELLIDEIELLHVDLWNVKAGSLDGSTPTDSDESSEAEADELERTLRTRLSALVPRRHRD
jgi:hypothetical protein